MTMLVIPSDDNTQLVYRNDDVDAASMAPLTVED